MDKRKPIILGLGHVSRTGKDSLANYLLLACKRRHLVAVKRPFAWKLKDIAHQLFGWAGLRDPDYYESARGETARSEILPDLEMTPVQLWVKLGSAMREQVHAATWVDYVMKADHKADVVVITDVRHPNEVEEIRNRGGRLIKVVRPGCKPISAIDEMLSGYNGWDSVLGKTGKLDELQAAAKTLADWCKHGGDFPYKNEP